VPERTHAPAEGRAPVQKPNRRRRVRKRAEFERIQRTGERINTRRFVLILSRQPGGSQPSRLGVTASRKVGNAVVRNRAKRVVREAFRATRSLWPSPMDLVVIVRRPLSSTSLGEVVDEWRGAAPRIVRRYNELGRSGTRPRSEC
jgi:ribonuclease P protein component